MKNKPKYAKVDFSLQPIADNVVWDGVIQKDSMWAYADQGSFKMRLREVYKDYGRFKKQAKELQTFIREDLAEFKQNKKLADKIFALTTPQEDDVSENTDDVQVL